MAYAIGMPIGVIVGAVLWYFFVKPRQDRGDW